VKTIIPAATPPIVPSQVFLGLNLGLKARFPIDRPNAKANVSTAHVVVKTVKTQIAPVEVSNEPRRMDPSAADGIEMTS